MAALAQSTRLQTFRLLIAQEPGGIPAGELARLVEVPQNTMSAHLAILARAGLIVGEHVSGTLTPGGGIDWSFQRKRELSL